MEKGYLSLVLHAHLPFVRDPEHEYFLEEQWLYEAITETYVPLIRMFEDLLKDQVPCRITMSMTPPLIAMLMDELLQDRYIHHIHQLIELAGKEVARTKKEDLHFHDTAKHYLEKFKESKQVFLKYKKDLVQAFKVFQDAGILEIMTCGATHGFLPLMDEYDTAVRAQIQVAVRQYESVFHRKPRGIWLPECGYYPGVEKYLDEEGIRFFLIDTHGVLHATPRPKYGIFAPIYCENGVAAFGRDVESSKQVWSAIEGYPGDQRYREFYRDIGFDLDYDYIKPYISPDGMRVNTGIKYYKITGTDHKEAYNRADAIQAASDHAANFMFNRQKQVEHLYEFMGKKPIVISPYDAELYGHWWYEGPEFLNFLIRKSAYDQTDYRLISPIDYLYENELNQVATPARSSWGYKGYAETWLDDSNHWIYRHLHKIAGRMKELANRFYSEGGFKERALNQAAREVLLAQSSDWAFIMHTGTMVPYAQKRTKLHVANFNKIYKGLLEDKLDEEWLRDIEVKNNIFPAIDFKVYS